MYGMEVYLGTTEITGVLVMLLKSELHKLRTVAIV